MARLGEYEYPDVTVEEAAALSKKLADDFDNGQAAKDDIVKRLGFKTASHDDFAKHLRTLQQFGIVNVGKERVRRTRLMRRLTDPRMQPGYAAALGEAALNVPVFRAIYQWLNGQVPANKEEFVAAVVGVTRVDMRKEEAEIDRLWEVTEATVKQIFTAARASRNRRVKIPRERAMAFEPEQLRNAIEQRTGRET
jgi:hypothetical protein